MLAWLRRETKSPFQIKTPHVNKRGLLNPCIKDAPLKLARSKDGQGGMRVGGEYRCTFTYRLCV